MMRAAAYSVEVGTTGPRMLKNFGRLMFDYLQAQVNQPAASAWLVVLKDHGLVL